MLGLLVLGFAGAWMIGACGSGNEPEGPTSILTGRQPEPPSRVPIPANTPPNMASGCPASDEEPCMRYRTELAGDPNKNDALRAKYSVAFAPACYLSDATPGTFNCFYQKWEKACEDAVQIGKVSGNAPYDPGYMCEPVGNGDYTLQIGPDKSNITRIYLEPAPRQTPFIPVDGMAMEVSGPYRNLVDPKEIGPAYPFDRNSGVPDGSGGFLKQRDWVLAVNRKHNGGKIRSDLAGYKFPCKPDGVVSEMCTEPEFLEDPFDPVGTKPNVHHVVPMKDPRCCIWGTNSYKNAAVISQKLNAHFANNDPPAEEVKRLNSAPAYTP